MSRQAILRLTDTFFRRWWLYVIPVVLLAAVGFMSVRGVEKKYRSTGSISVQSTSFLATLDGLNVDPGFGYETPAVATAGSINSLISTDQFVEQIATNAGIDASQVSNPFTIAEIRSAVVAYPAGRSLVKVSALHEDPGMAQALSLATMGSFTQNIIAGEVEDSRIAVEVLTDRAETYRDAVDEAEAALAEYVAAHPVESEPARPPDQVAEISRLSSAITRAEDRLFDTQGQLETAQLKQTQTESNVRARLRVVDSPRAPLGPETQMKQQILNFALFLLIGLLLAIGGVVVGTMLDRTIRFPADVNDRLGQRVLAIVPKEGSRRWGNLRSLVVTGTSGVGSSRPAATPAAPARGVPFAPADYVAAAPVAIPNGDSQPAVAAEMHPTRRQRRRPGGTRPSVTLRKDK